MKKLILAIIGIITAGFIMTAPAILSNTALAADKNGNNKCVSTAILDGCDNGQGSSIVNVLMVVVNIFSVVIGVLAAIGVAVTGTQYLTAGGSEEKTRKAKRRLFEIVIGIAAYVLLYVFLRWLIPSFETGS